MDLRKIIVYALLDPRDSTMRYIGKTKQRLKTRICRHQRDALMKIDDRWEDTTHRANWLRTIYKEDLTPEVLELETVEEQEGNESERFWISYFRGIGCDLTNSTEGGDGGIISRVSLVSDEEICALYSSGVKNSKAIAKNLHTCAKRVVKVLRRNNISLCTIGKRIKDDLGNEFRSITEASVK